MLHAGPFGGRANPWNFVDSPGEWCHIPPPPPEKYCGNRTPTMNEDVFPIENGRFPNVMLVNSGVETDMKANRISMGAASVLELCKNTQRHEHFHFHYFPLFLFFGSSDVLFFLE